MNGVTNTSSQGDVQFVELLEEMGCSREETTDGIRVLGPGWKQNDKGWVGKTMDVFL